MWQKNYFFNSPEEAQEGLSAIKRDIQSQNDFHDALWHIFTCGFEKREIEPLLDSADKILRGVKRVGMSEFASGGGFGEQGIKINLILSNHASFKIFELPCHPGEEEFSAKKLNDFIKQNGDVKGIGLFPVNTELNVTKFLQVATDGAEEIPVFGAMANMVWQSLKSISPEESVFVIGEKIFSSGFVAVMYCGENLQIFMDYILGWQPVGREFSFTLGEKKKFGESCVKKIDEQPALNIYKKYFGVDWDENFVWNICEFPLMVRRNGENICMIPLAKSDDGELYFSGALYEGEKIFFSYGTEEEVLGSSFAGSERMKKFSPNAVFIFPCGNRINYLKNDAERELDYYRADFPEMTFAHGHFEISYQNKKGGVLNSSFIAVGLRENSEDKKISNAEFSAKEKFKTKGAIPLPYRMSHFLHVVTQELEEMADEANSANRAKSAFLSNMSHEIRTPINAVLGMDEMILRNTNEDETYNFALDIETAGKNLLGLVNDILDFSKIEAGKMEIIPVEYKTATLLNDLSNMIQKRAEDKNLKFIVNADENLPEILFGDEIRIKQVITNILTNAVKYTEKGSVTLSVEQIKKFDDKIILKFSVKDTGIGIKAEDIKKLFSAFERIEEKRNRSIEGTGLGMNITKELLEMMGSRLEVSSVYGEGSTFSFEIEQKIIGKNLMGDFRKAHKKSVSDRKKYRAKFIAPDAKILVVDDTPMNLTVIKGLLRETKLQIDTADSGKKCLEKIFGNDYEIIFLDHRMPDMDGAETLEKIRQSRAKNTPVVAMTANNIVGAREEYISMGFNEYLLKPVDSEILEEIVKKFLPSEKMQSSIEFSSDKIFFENETLAKLSEIKNLNVADAVKSAGSKNLYVEVITEFAKNIIDNAAEIEKYFNDGDIKNYTIKVHALKSSARIVGAEKLSKLAEYLEKVGDEKNLSEIQNKTGELLEQYRNFYEPLKFLFDEQSEEKFEEITADQLLEALETVREFLSVFDYENAEEILKNLSEYKKTSEIEEKISEIKIEVSRLNQEKAVELLDNLISKL